MKKVVAILSIVNLLIGVGLFALSIMIGIHDAPLGSLLGSAALVFIIYEQYLLYAYKELKVGNVVLPSQLLWKFGDVFTFTACGLMVFISILMVIGLFTDEHLFMASALILFGMLNAAIAFTAWKRMAQKPVFQTRKPKQVPHVNDLMMAPPDLRYWARQETLDELTSTKEVYQKAETLAEELGVPAAGDSMERKSPIVMTHGGHDLSTEEERQATLEIMKELTAPSEVGEAMQSITKEMEIPKDMKLGKHTVTIYEGHKPSSANADGLLPNENNEEESK